MGIRSTTDSDLDTYNNNTNLALKGIIGIHAMSLISLMLENQEDAHYFLVNVSISTTQLQARILMTCAQNISSTYAQKWEEWALSPVSSNSQHILATYGGDPQSSWSLTYNLCAAKMLSTLSTNRNVRLFLY